MKYVLTQDDDCHWYVIPADKQDEWCQYVQTINDFDYDSDEDYPIQPEWVKEVGGSPSLVEFETYEIR